MVGGSRAAFVKELFPPSRTPLAHQARIAMCRVHLLPKGVQLPVPAPGADESSLRDPPAGPPIPTALQARGTNSINGVRWGAAHVPPEKPSLVPGAHFMLLGLDTPAACQRDFMRVDLPNRRVADALRPAHASK